MSDAQENAACAEFMQQVRDFMKKSTERHDALERRLRESLAPTIEEHGDRLDRHDTQLGTIQTNIERLANRMTVQEGLLEKTFTVVNLVSLNVNRLLELQGEKTSTVIVDPTLVRPRPPPTSTPSGGR
jgi:exonuclease VII large subunit